MTHYTSIEQSKHLLDLGLDPKTADMCWTKYIDNGVITSLHATIDYGIVPIDYPCWSLAALVEVMPKSIIDEYTSKGWLGMCLLYYSSWRWIVYYSNEDIDSPAIHEEKGETLLEATYNMVCWLIEEGHIKKEA